MGGYVSSSPKPSASYQLALIPPNPNLPTWIKLHQQGLTFKAIATETGDSYSSVSQALRKHLRRLQTDSNTRIDLIKENKQAIVNSATQKGKSDTSGAVPPIETAETILNATINRAAQRYSDIALGLIDADPNQRQALEKLLKRSGLLAEEGVETISIYEGMSNSELTERLRVSAPTILGLDLGEFKAYDWRKLEGNPTPFFLPWLDPAGTAD